MNRRDFFTVSIPQNRQRQNFGSIPVTSTGISPYAGTWTISEVKHLLKRTMFGSPLSDINYFLGLGINDSVDTLLELINHPSYTQPSPPLNNYNNLIIDPQCAAGLPWPGTPDTNNGTVYTFTSRKKSLKSWWLSQMLNQPRSLREKMVLFWCNHFVIEFDTVQTGTYIYKYNQLIRDYALGNFKTLTKEITINSAMLRYLNGDQNSANAPNENYGRELQELFTVGKDSSGNPQYTEDDVKEAAKVLSGWRNDVNGSGVSANGFNSYFQSNRHNQNNKQFSSWYNNTTIQGQTGAAGANEIDDLLNMIFNRTEVAENICRRLYRWFVYYEIDSNAETNVIQPLAAIFRNNNYDIVPVLSALFKSEHFFDVMSRGCLIKSPVDFNVGMSREFGIVFPDNADITAQYAAWDRLRSLAATMQDDIGDPPNVAGLTAYYQEPSYHELWISSDTLPKRNQLTDRMMSNGYSNYGQTIEIDSVAFTETLTNPLDPVDLINEVLSMFFAIDSTPGIEAYLLTVLLSGQSTNSYWSSAWNDYITDPTNTMYYNIVKTRLDSFYKYIMDLSEYQLS
jgi:uncharacterized protein (DUF1800 family)